MVNKRALIIGKSLYVNMSLPFVKILQIRYSDKIDYTFNKNLGLKKYFNLKQIYTAIENVQKIHFNSQLKLWLRYFGNLTDAI